MDTFRGARQRLVALKNHDTGHSCQINHMKSILFGDPWHIIAIKKRLFVISRSGVRFPESAPFFSVG